MEPKWSPNGTKMEPKSAKGRPKGGAENQVAKKPLGQEKLGHVGAHGRILSKLGAALGAILEKVDFEGGPKIVIFEAKST